MKANRMCLSITFVIIFAGCGWAGALPRASLRADLMGQPGIAKAYFLFEKAPFESCHASTIEETENYLVSAYFAGTGEGNRDVCIWVSRKKKGTDTWLPPVQVAHGVQYHRIDSDDVHRWPCWNPVLYQAKDELLYLFYKVGPNPDTWWGVLKTSNDQGESWSQARRLPEGISGPVRAKPVLLDDGTLLCGSSTEDNGWRVHMEFTKDLGRTWSRTDALNDGKEFGAIQPTILRHSGGMVQILCRSDDHIRQSWSSDGGKSWTPLTKSILPNPNAGIDVVKLSDGRHLLVYNHSDGDSGGRSQLNISVTDDGKVWKAGLKLEDGKTVEGKNAYGAYPGAILGSDGLVHIVYTWRRDRINYVAIDPEKLVLRDMPDGNWPD
ncbi:MAG: sialidase family protein [Planctomycetota bacterium]